MSASFAASLALAVLTGIVLGGAARGAAVGEPAPDFVLKSASGSNLRLSEYRGEVVAIAFWASWCGECRDRLAELAALHERYAGTGFRLLAVSLDGDARAARRAADDMGAAYPVLFDESGAVGETYEADSVPAVVLVDRDGRLRYAFAGSGAETGPAIRDRVRGLLRE